MTSRKIIFSIMFVIAFVAVIISSQPMFLKAVMAKYKSTDQFLALPADSRIRYEEGAEVNAQVMSNELNESVDAVEQILGLPFNGPIEILVCATQESFNSYVFLSVNVRGAAYWGKVFLSPGAFNRGSLSTLSRHELTHHLFYTYLGNKAHIENIPLWFREGIAVYVADGGGKYTERASIKQYMNTNQLNALLAGNFDAWFSSDNPADAIAEDGGVNRNRYRIGGHFVHYMHDVEPDKFNELLEQLVTGNMFDDAIESTYSQSVATLLLSFKNSLIVSQ